MSKHDTVTKRNRRPKSDKRIDYTASTMAALKRLEELLQPDNRLQVEVIGRLVHQQHVGPAEQDAGQGHAFQQSLRDGVFSRGQPWTYVLG